MENGSEASVMAMEPKPGQMGPNTMVIGSMERPTARVHLHMSTETATSGTGCMIKQMALENTLIKMELLMKDNGKTIFRTEKESNDGLTDQFMKDFTQKERNMEWEATNGTTAQNTRVNGTIIKFLELEFTNGLMDENIKENGSTTTWKALGITFGMMVVPFKDSIKMIRSTVTESIDGLTAENTQETGLEVNNMDLESTLFLLME